jgi:hypothetical protein
MQLFVRPWFFSAAHWFKMNAICGSNSSVMSWLRACCHSCSAVFLVFIGAAARERSAARLFPHHQLLSSCFLQKYYVKKSLSSLKHKRLLAARSQQVILFAGTS